VVIVEVFIEGCLMVLEFCILGIFPLLQFGVEVPSPRLGFEKFAPIQFGAEGGEMTRGVPGAHTAEIAVAIDLAMPFLLAVVTNKVRVVHAILVSEMFLGRDLFVGVGILGNLYSSRDDGIRFFNDWGGKSGWSRGGGEWSGCALVQRGMAVGESQGIRD
jgi:hypothetical protein